MPNVQDTINFIQRAHEGQVDKGGNPYWLHPVSVMNRLGDDAPEATKLVALLHDVIEDKRATADDLLALGYESEVVEAVKLVSRPKDEVYIDWIKRIADSGNRMALHVKIVDIEDNSDPTRGWKVPSGLLKRYTKALKLLRPALDQAI